MGRTSASAENKELARQFAHTVCAPTDNINDMVARSGPFSLYAALAECFPSCVKTDGGSSRYGLQEAEFNKAVQAGGFRRERDRRVNALTKRVDPLGAGMYLFSMRVWKDPSSPRDREELMQGWRHLVERFPQVAKVCSVDRFLEVVSKFHDAWQPNAGRARKKQKMHGNELAEKPPSSSSSLDAPVVNIDPSRRMSDLERHPLMIATLVDSSLAGSGKSVTEKAKGNLFQSATVSQFLPAKSQCFEDFNTSKQTMQPNLLLGYGAEQQSRQEQSRGIFQQLNLNSLPVGSSSRVDVASGHSSCASLHGSLSWDSSANCANARDAPLMGSNVNNLFDNLSLARNSFIQEQMRQNQLLQDQIRLLLNQQLRHQPAQQATQVGSNTSPAFADLCVSYNQYNNPKTSAPSMQQQVPQSLVPASYDRPAGIMLSSVNSNPLVVQSQRF
uniref:Uncharacterized protein n=1 Tax=Hanusia phi TaxID=3032 RepID=A0A7S0H934_9CRYP|mmetsp:Transcript_15795/g.36118  ORF Transcript_15795/g.36118 Transcript_15795/m.36118 type:complete len:444 (+) Transcript_15795:52-1383(+)